jgi:hypothetical protein
MNRTLGLTKLSRTLLATTCLTIFAGVAGATNSFPESSAPGGDFPGSFATAYSLPVGTNEITGSLFNTGDQDWVIFSGLLGGASYSFAGTAVGLSVNVRDSSNLSLQSFGITGSSETGVIPGDGELIAEVFNSTDNAGAYTLDLTAPLAAPDLGTVWSLGTGLAGALALRRRKRS